MIRNRKSKSPTPADDSIKNRFDFVDGSRVQIGQNCHQNGISDLEFQLEHETYALPLKLINILEKPDNWRKRSLNNFSDKTGQSLYVQVHQDPVEYRNMYQYLVFR